MRFWSGWRRASGTNVHTSWRTTGFSTMTTCLLTYYPLFDNSWLPKTLQWLPNPIHLNTAPWTFSCSPRWNYSWKGVILTWLRRSMQNH
jgi:hypothetical protein